MVRHSRGRRWLMVLGIAAALTGAVRPALAGGPPDIRGHWAEAGITRLLVKGLVEGFEDGRFQPDEPVTRAQFVKMLLGAMGRASDALLLGRTGGIFADVSEEHWASGYIAVAYELGLVRGQPGGLFLPDAWIQRCELAALLVRAAGGEAEAVSQEAPAIAFRDAGDVPAWARGYVAVAVRLGFVTGFADGGFRPRGQATRAETAALLCRLMGELGLWPDYVGLFGGYDAQRGVIFLRQAGGFSPFALGAEPFVYRNGQPAQLSELAGLDELFLTVDASGRVAHLEARITDLVGTIESFDAASFLARFLPDRRSTPVDLLIPGQAKVFLNGRPVERQALAPGDRLYVVFDSLTGAVRIVDAVRAVHRGKLGSFDEKSGRLILVVDGTEFTLRVGARVIVFLDGDGASPASLAAGDFLLAGVGEDGLVEYIEATRGGGSP